MARCPDEFESHPATTGEVLADRIGARLAELQIVLDTTSWIGEALDCHVRFWVVLPDDRGETIEYGPIRGPDLRLIELVVYGHVEGDQLLELLELHIALIA